MSKLQDNLNDLRSILSNGAFPDDIKVIGSWERELTTAQREHELFRHPALISFWQSIKDEIQALNDMLLNEAELPERVMILKYRNFIQLILTRHETALTRAEALENRIETEATRLRNQPQ